MLESPVPKLKIILVVFGGLGSVTKLQSYLGQLDIDCSISVRNSTHPSESIYCDLTVRRT